MPSLDDVYAAIAADPFWDHLRKPGINLVRGFGARRPKVMVVGEAPGATENARGRPFCGPSGKVLDQLMETAGLRLTDEPDGWGDDNMGNAGTLHEQDPELWQANAYVTNVVKYRPQGNATPGLAEILHARDGFKQHLMSAGFKPVIDDSLPDGAGSLRQEWAALGGPRVIVAVGGVAHSALSPMNFEGVTRWAGRPLVAVNAEGEKARGYWIISQLHPAYGLRPGPRQAAIQDKMERDWEAMGAFLRQEGLL